MKHFIADTLHLLLRHIRATLRLPIWIAVSLVQPVIWLTLFGQLFGRVADLPGFGGGSYIAFLTPGVVAMTALFGSAWSGIGIVEDINHGVMDRLLATPVHRGALIAARVLHAALTVAIQTVIVLALGIALGSGLPGGALGFVAVLLPAVLIAAGFSALSNGVALLTRREETLIAVINFFGMPLTFLSASFMSRDLMPGWMQVLSMGNPVNWAVVAAREAMLGRDWTSVWFNSALLAGFTLAACILATLAFRGYRRAG